MHKVKQRRRSAQKTCDKRNLHRTTSKALFHLSSQLAGACLTCFSIISSQTKPPVPVRRKRQLQVLCKTINDYKHQMSLSLSSSPFISPSPGRRIRCPKRPICTNSQCAVTRSAGRVRAFCQLSAVQRQITQLLTSLSHASRQRPFQKTPSRTLTRHSLPGIHKRSGSPIFPASSKRIGDIRHRDISDVVRDSVEEVPTATVGVTVTF